MSRKSDNRPIQDAVVAFCCLVRAVADGNAEWERSQIGELAKYGFKVEVGHRPLVASPSTEVSCVKS